jgi:hypothetical protein
MNRIARAACAAVAYIVLVSGLAIVTVAAAQDNPRVTDVGSPTPTPDQRQLYAGIQDAIFKNRQQLLELVGDRKSRPAVCTPALKESYDLFQASIQEKLDVLWDLDIYAAKYGLTKKQHHDVKVCAAQMERYQDNFRLWQELNRLQESGQGK